MSTVYNDPIMLDSTGQDIVTKLDSIASLMGDGVIDDTSTATDTTWSSNKITSELAGKQDKLTFDYTPKDDSLNPVYSDGIYDSIIGVYDNLELGLGWDSKNILEIANTSKEVNGITFTVNNDGTITLDGTATSATLYALNKFTGAELKKYGENLLMTGGKDNSTFLTLMTQDWTYTKDDKGDGVEINISELTDATEYTVIIQIANGTTLSNYIMSPMIRLVSIIDPSFKKHHDSVDVVKADKSNVIANTKLIKDTVGWSGKNKLPNNGVSTSSSGVNAVVNADKSVTLNNTSNASFSFVLATFTLKKGSYILSGMPTGTFSDLVQIELKNNNESGTQIVAVTNSSSEEKSFTLNADTTVFARIYARSGVTFSNTVFKPMIRPADILDSTYEPYFGSTAFPRSEQAVLGAKQLLDISKAIGGTGITLNITEKGRVINFSKDTASAWCIVKCRFSTTPNTDYRISTKATSVTGKVALKIQVPVSETNIKTSTFYSQPADFDFDFNSGNNSELELVLFGTDSTASVCNVTYEDLLITLGTDTDRTYAPYAMTNKELTNKMFPRSEQAVLGAYNIINNIMENHEVLGVTFIVNADKTISLSGISTGDLAHTPAPSKYDICLNLTNLKKGRYKLVGCPTGGSASTYRLIISNANTSSFVTDLGNGAIFDYDPDAVDPWVYCYIRINSGQDMTGKVFKPMITTDLNATYDDYVAPAMTNRELTEQFPTKYTSTGLTITNGTISEGGYCKIGNVVLVNIRLQATETGSVVDIFGLPTYTGANKVICSGANFSDDVSAYAYITSGGHLFIKASDVVASKNYVVSGMYLAV